MTIKEASKLWDLSERRIRKLAQEGRIVGAIKTGGIWHIPLNANKPIDKRFKTDFKYILNLTEKDFIELDNKLNLLNSKRPLSKDLIEMLRDSDILDWTYNSNAIEGNSLTLKETKVVLEGITIGGKSVIEHLEVINHRDVIYYLEELIKNKNSLKGHDIKTIHNLILKGIDDKNAGVYRNKNVLISGATSKPCDYIKVSEGIERLMNLYPTWSNLHPIVRSTLLHGEFVFIHPFIDGNGRTARLLMNFEVMKCGFVPIIITKEKRIKYYEALDKAMTSRDYTDFVKLIIEEELKNLDKYLEVLN